MKKSELTKSEWLIMNRVWVHQKVTAREVTEDLSKKTKWSYNTVKTMLARMAEKGWVTETKIGGLCFYRPAVNRGTTIKNALDDIVERVLDGSFEPLVSYLGNKKRLSKKDIDVLDKLIKESRKSENE